MKNHKKTKYLLIIFIVIFLFCLATNTVNAQQTCEQKYPGGDGVCRDTCKDWESEDSASGLCSDANETCCHEFAETASLQLQIPILQYTESSNVYEYAGNIYTAALYIIVPIAIVVIIISGIIWASSGGNAEQMQSAKNMILRAFIALGIALLSYTILSVVGITSIGGGAGVTYLEPTSEEYGILEFENSVGMSTGVTGANYPSIGGKCFPVAANSFKKISWNWGNRRSDGKRCHAGIDIYTKSPGHVIAIAEGVITGISKNFYTCKSGWTGPGKVGKIMINHGIHTINYAEIDVDKFAGGIRIGKTVKAGEFLGVAGHCGMLHFELYKGKTSNSTPWYPPSGKRVGGAANYCRAHYLSSKPANLLDPSKTIQALQSNMCGK
ncbi:MAG: peptidoglycan DD-metalloendopeptidase family protein [Candidatus Buchananbacteria bacterium]|nr:peptidoglycan DD-metalloendopeptidase family protein [Candidatus Buchananbacteria bacterium]